MYTIGLTDHEDALKTAPKKTVIITSCHDRTVIGRKYL